MAPATFAGLQDVSVIRVEALADTLPGGTAFGRYATGRPGAMLLSMPMVARYLVSDGRSIEYCVEPDADPAAVRLFLHGAAKAALLHQRGDLPLHACAVAPPGQDLALAICGRSGLGKSTLSIELQRRGWRLLADDMTRISWDGARALAWPGTMPAKLWRDACDAFGIATEGLSRVREDMEKFQLPLSPVDAPMPLRAVLELDLATGDLVEVDAVSQKMAILTRQTFQPKQVRGMGLAGPHMRIVARVAGGCHVGQLRGARTTPVARLADQVEEAGFWTEA